MTMRVGGGERYIRVTPDPQGGAFEAVGAEKKGVKIIANRSA
jgi:hypothetical protein